MSSTRSDENGTITNEDGSVTTYLGITFPAAIAAIIEDAERHPERGRTSDRIHAYSCWQKEGQATPVPKIEPGTSSKHSTSDEASINDDQDTKPAAAKKRCIDVDGPTSSLPAELWANVLGYLYFDEVLTCTAVSKSFYNDVPTYLEHLCIRYGKSMVVSTNTIERFVRVKDVFVYLFHESLHADDGHLIYRFENDAATHAAWFLSNIPNLQWAFLGGEDNWHRNMVRHGVVYDVNEDVMMHPASFRQYVSMIKAFCDAYRQGDISDTVDIEGLLPIQGPKGRCAWKRKAPQLSPPQWRTDVACQTCDMICMSYPPAKVLMLTDMEVPCIEMENRMAISKQRDEKNFEKNLTDALVTVVESSLHDTMMLPPKYDTKGLALSYRGYQYAMMENLIELGANIKDPRIFQAIMQDVNDSPCTIFRDSKRIIKQTTYNKLKDIGLELSQENFSIIDASDRRTRVIGDDMRRMRDQLNSADSVRDVKAAVTWLRGMVHHSDVPDRVTSTLERELSTEFTPQRRSEIKELFQELCAE